MAVLKFETVVLEIKQVTPTVKTIRFSVPHEFKFEPGQFVTLLVKIEGKTERRSYSISLSGKGFFETAINEVENGRVSPHIHKFKAGDKLNAQGPLGVFILKNDSSQKENVFISTGTGVTPFVSMITKLLEISDKKVILLAGYRHEDEVLYDEYFRDLRSNYRNFEYYTIISQPSVNYKGNKGRVQFLLEKHVAHKFAGDFYLCGLFEMVKDIGQLLTSKGVTKERIIFERYD